MLPANLRCTPEACVPARVPMNSLRQIIESSPSIRHLGNAGATEDTAPQPLAPPRWDWSTIRSVLVIRLRSIGDTVLATPSLVTLRRFLPQARIEILLEDWVAPVLEGSPLVDRVITIPKQSTCGARSPGPRASSHKIRCRLQFARWHDRDVSDARHRRAHTGLGSRIINMRDCTITSHLRRRKSGNARIYIRSSSNWPSSAGPACR